MRSLFFAATLLGLAAGTEAASRFVNAGGATPAPPYLSWATAAQHIQDAVDVSSPGDVIWVSNGVYSAGGRAAPGHVLTNRVMIGQAIAVRSVGGPGVTAIAGAGPAGPGAVRCAYLTNGAELSGFTLAGGATRTSDDGVCYTDNSGGGAFLDHGGTLTNCVVRDGSANFGGGVFSLNGRILSCTLENNTALLPPGAGGGAYGAGGAIEGTLVRGNAGVYGAGAFVDAGCTLRDTWLVENASAQNAGGVFLSGGTVLNATIRSNAAVQRGAGAYVWLDGALRNALIHTNLANDGAGVFVDRGGFVQSCTIVGNAAATLAGGLSSWLTGTVDNCLLALNSAPFASNYWQIGSTQIFSFSFTQPVASGPGNVSGNPRFVAASSGDFRITTLSPAYDHGTNLPWMAGQWDLDGRPRIYVDRADIGAYERNPADVNADTDSDALPDWWEWQFFGHVTNTLPGQDSDTDDMDALEEWIAGTDPTNTASYFQVAAVGRTGAQQVVEWPSVQGRLYTLYRLTNLLQQESAVLLAADLPAAPPVNQYTDTVQSARTVIYKLNVRLQ